MHAHRLPQLGRIALLFVLVILTSCQRPGPDVATPAPESEAAAQARSVVESFISLWQRGNLNSTLMLTPELAGQLSTSNTLDTLIGVAGADVSLKELVMVEEEPERVRFQAQMQGQGDPTLDIVVLRTGEDEWRINEIRTTPP